MKYGCIINQFKAACSIYESGLMIKDILRGKIDDYVIDYYETDVNLWGLRKYPYDFCVINWHPYTFPMKKDVLDKLPGKKIAIVVEVGPVNPNPITPDWFDAFMIIDSTHKRERKNFPFPRPILKLPTKPLLSNDKLVLGSFGFFASGYENEKKFDEIVGIANDSGRESIVRINLPLPSYTQTEFKAIKGYGDWLKRLAEKNVDVQITYEYKSREDLVGWLSEHNMNCFPYYRDRPGLSAVTDQAISAGRAIMTTECNTFRHLHKYISYYPKQSYVELLESTVAGVHKMQEDWSEESFRNAFREMLVGLKVL